MYVIDCTPSVKFAVLSEVFAVSWTLVIFPVIDVEVSILGVPVRVAHGVFFGQILLRSPHVLAAVRVLL